MISAYLFPVGIHKITVAAMINSVVQTTVKGITMAICDLANDFQTKFNFPCIVL